MGDIMPTDNDLSAEVLRLTENLVIENGRRMDTEYELRQSLRFQKIASEKVARLTTEHAQVVAANQALATENARLVKRAAEARKLLRFARDQVTHHFKDLIRAFLAGEGK